MFPQSIHRERSPVAKIEVAPHKVTSREFLLGQDAGAKAVAMAEGRQQYIIARLDTNSENRILKLIFVVFGRFIEGTSQHLFNAVRKAKENPADEAASEAFYKSLDARVRKITVVPAKETVERSLSALEEREIVLKALEMTGKTADAPEGVESAILTNIVKVHTACFVKSKTDSLDLTKVGSAALVRQSIEKKSGYFSVFLTEKCDAKPRFEHMIASTLLKNVSEILTSNFTSDEEVVKKRELDIRLAVKARTVAMKEELTLQLGKYAGLKAEYAVSVEMLRNVTSAFKLRLADAGRKADAASLATLTKTDDLRAKFGTLHGSLTQLIQELREGGVNVTSQMAFLEQLRSLSEEKNLILNDKLEEGLKNLSAFLNSKDIQASSKKEVLSLVAELQKPVSEFKLAIESEASAKNKVTVLKEEEKKKIDELGKGLAAKRKELSEAGEKIEIFQRLLAEQEVLDTVQAKLNVEIRKRYNPIVKELNIARAEYNALMDAYKKEYGEISIHNASCWFGIGAKPLPSAPSKDRLEAIEARLASAREVLDAIKAPRKENPGVEALIRQEFDVLKKESLELSDYLAKVKAPTPPVVAAVAQAVPAPAAAPAAAAVVESEGEEELEALEDVEEAAPAAAPAAAAAGVEDQDEEEAAVE